MTKNTKKRSDVPPAMVVQLSRLFGAKSKIASVDARSDSEWRRDLKLVLVELWNYVDANVDTDIVHRVMIDSGFNAAAGSLDRTDFWAGYAEGITRILLCLLGDYPDHRETGLRGKKKSHYKLDRCRSVISRQTREQKLQTLCWFAPAVLQLRSNPLDEIHEFREQLGFDIPIEAFLDWYKLTHPEDYLKVF